MTQKFYDIHKVYVCLHKACDLRYSMTGQSIFYNDETLNHHIKMTHQKEDVGNLKKVKNSQDHQIHICMHPKCKNNESMKLYSAYAPLAKHIATHHRKDFKANDDISSICHGFVKEISCNIEDCHASFYSYEKTLKHFKIAHNITDPKIEKDEEEFNKFVLIKEKAKFPYAQVEENKRKKKGRPRKNSDEKNEIIYKNIDILNNILCLVLKMSGSLEDYIQTNKSIRTLEDHPITTKDLDNFLREWHLEDLVEKDNFRFFLDRLYYFLNLNNDEKMQFNDPLYNESEKDVFNLLMRGNYKNLKMISAEAIFESLFALLSAWVSIHFRMEAFVQYFLLLFLISEYFGRIKEKNNKFFLETENTIEREKTFEIYVSVMKKNRFDQKTLENERNDFYSLLLKTNLWLNLNEVI